MNTDSDRLERLQRIRLVVHIREDARLGIKVEIVVVIVIQRVLLFLSP